MELLKSILQQSADKAISLKFFVILLTTWLFYIDKLNQDGWVTVVLSTTGMRVINEVSAMYKDIRTAGSSPSRRGSKS